MLTLGLSNMRDAAAALVQDGRIVAAAEEERFVRIKHVSAVPLHAVRYCLILPHHQLFMQKQGVFLAQGRQFERLLQFHP